MESFKHSCPFCGQHIEYTVGYCGQQMQCPMCGQTVTFPAVPPKRAGPALHIKKTATRPLPKWTAKFPKLLSLLVTYQHWGVVAQCAVPFVIVAVLLGGAVFVKNKFGAPAEDSSTSTVQADPEAWKKMADLNKADQSVQVRMRDLTTARANLDMAQARCRQAQNMEAFQRKSAEDKMALAQKQLNDAHTRFDKAYEAYQQLGGSVDYRSQIKN